MLFDINFEKKNGLHLPCYKKDISELFAHQHVIKKQETPIGTDIDINNCLFSYLKVANQTRCVVLRFKSTGTKLKNDMVLMFTQNHQLKRIQACEKEIKSHGNFFEKKNGKIEKHT